MKRRSCVHLGAAACAALLTLIAAPPPALGAGAFLRHESPGSAPAGTWRALASAHSITLPAPAPGRGVGARPARSPAQPPAPSAAASSWWSPAFWLARPQQAMASPAYGGPQPAFPIYKEGYWPASAYNPAVGRLYIAVSRNVLGECTATVVGPSVVLTAAHCLFNPKKHHFYSAFLFVPGLHGRMAPDGAWRGRNQYIIRSFARHVSVSVDYGFLTLRTQHGRRIGRVTGSEPILAYSRVHRILSLGYPASGVFARRCSTNSCYVWACYSPLGGKVKDRTGAYEVGMGCHSGEGSSGGPWFERFHHRWYVASNVSTGVTFRPNPGYTTNQWGPYFDRDTLKLLKYAKSHG